MIASQHLIRHPGQGKVITYTTASGGAGKSVSRTFTRPEITKAAYVAVLYRDNARNWGLLRSAQIKR